MDSCLNVEKKIQKVMKKLRLLNDRMRRILNETIDSVNAIQTEFSQSTELTNAQSLVLSQCVKKVNDVILRIASEHRVLRGTVSKVGKTIDKNFFSDFWTTSNEELFNSSKNARLLNYVICEHFLREGRLDIAEKFTTEVGVQMEQNKMESFSELNRILDALKRRDLQPALQWAQSNRQKLQDQNSSLEIRLHRLHFIDLLQKGSAMQNEAILYARKNFQHLAWQHTKDIQVLMGSLMYIKQGLNNSPYSYLLDPIHWAEICNVFRQDFCKLLGIAVESPLTLCVNAGCTAFPASLNTGVWNTHDELPAEIELFHSVYVCPILRQRSSETNPPVSLVCGHVISTEAHDKLSIENNLKCPFCSLEQNPSDARLIHF